MSNKRKPSLVGQRFGMLSVISDLDDRITRSGEKVPSCLCQCDCGTQKAIDAYSLRAGRSNSCGCRIGNHFASNAKRLRQKHPGEYNSWAQMRSRCNDPGANGYENYGGRGIKVCERWSSFELFLEDMGHRPEGFSIDRINVNGDYEPSNCRWASVKEQACNKRTTRRLEAMGLALTIEEWAKRSGISKAAIRARIQRGWPAELAVTTVRAA